eukprot:m.477162 g.477162  ORF g.477162 m.477162 type:complete len:275 (+) comp20760_c0_seq1:290-1114(+)
MAPPKFKDIGKSANDLFNDDFPSGKVSFKLTSKAANGATFTVEGVKKDTTVTGSLDSKYTHSSGVTIREKWTTNSGVETELSGSVSGAKLSLTTGFLPNQGLSSAVIKADHKGSNYAVDATVAAVGKPKADLGVVGSWTDYVFGAGVTYDVNAGSVSATKLAVGYNDRDVAIASKITNGSAVEGSVFHAPVDGISTGVKFGWSKSQPEKTTFAIAGKYQLDRDAFIKAKVDKELKIGLGYTQNLRPGVKLSLGMLIDGKQMQSNSVGLSFKLDN